MMCLERVQGLTVSLSPLSVCAVCLFVCLLVRACVRACVPGCMPACSWRNNDSNTVVCNNGTWALSDASVRAVMQLFVRRVIRSDKCSAVGNFEQPVVSLPVPQNSVLF